MTGNIANVVTIKELFAQKNGKLKIPPYQRPYKWSHKHVSQLLDDLKHHMDKGVNHYRVGTVVLHKHGSDLDIVDGQQRTVTLSLILYALGLTCEADNPLMRGDLNRHLLQNSISQRNIQNNYATIKQHLQGADENALKDFILKQCEVVQVVLTELSEAFQFFDSQNARGKSLEPYDLLKAFHLREMKDETEEVRLECVNTWEKSVEDKSLTPLFDDYLYRIRRWLRNESGFQFTKDDIDLFKGVTLSKADSKLPHVQPYRMLEAFFASNAQVVAAWEGMPQYPFQVNQTIINGKRFFEYIAHYEALLKTVTYQKGELFEDLNTYEGHDRTGDQYTRNLFNAALLCFIDRFGTEHVQDAAKTCFLWAYAMRFENYSVRKESMDNKGKEKFLRRIQYANHPTEITHLMIKRVEEPKVSDQGKDIYDKSSKWGKS